MLQADPTHIIEIRLEAGRHKISESWIGILRVPPVQRRRSPRRMGSARDGHGRTDG